MDLECFLSPSRARRLPEGSRERALASLALRQLWHALFDPCPKLLAAYPPDGKKVLDPFLDWADRERLSMGWSLHMHLLEWLSDGRPPLERDLVVELLGAAASRWTRGDKSTACGVALFSRRLPGMGVIGWKRERPADPRRVVLVKFESNDPAARSACGHQVLLTRTPPASNAWLEVPR